jgi:AcrR family transcriptional regulator
VAKNTKGEQSKNNIIECASSLFMKNGYNATGINDILACTGLPKGSFYFHFKSKKDLALSVCFYFGERIGSMVFNSAENRKWTEFINDLMNKMIASAEDNTHYGCPFAVLGLEIAFSEPDLAEYYSKAMKKLIDIFSEVLKFSNAPEAKIDALANKAFAIYEGYLLYYRISKDISLLNRMKTDLISVF